MNSSHPSLPTHPGYKTQVFLLGLLLFGLLSAGGIVNSLRVEGRLPNVRYGYLDQHLELLATNKHKEALPEFRTAALVDFDNAAAQLQLLSAAYQFHDVESVEIALRGLLSHTPNDSDLHGRLAVVLFETGKPDQALFHINREVLLDPDNTTLLTTHGAIMLALGRFPEAAASYQKALELDPASESARLGLESLSTNF